MGVVVASVTVAMMIVTSVVMTVVFMISMVVVFVFVTFLVTADETAAISGVRTVATN